MVSTTACYGNMMPDVSKATWNHPVQGAAFRVELRGSGLAIQERRVDVLDDAWAHCVACKDFRSCYDLSMAKLALSQAVSH